MRERRGSFKGTVERMADAVGLLTAPGDMALVTRGMPRLLVFACPDGCGEVVPVNLDPGTGPAWLHYHRGERHSLFPSVRRTEGCRSHFILWNDRIFWTESDRLEPDPDTRMLAARIRGRLSREQMRSYQDIADALGEIPWAVLVACRTLVQAGVAGEGTGDEVGWFRLRS